MKLSRLLALLAFSFATASSTFGQVQHRGMSPEQEFLLCAQKVLGKPVLWQNIFSGPSSSNRVPKVTCPMSRDEFVTALQKNETISVFEDKQFAFLATHYNFKNLQIKLKTSQRKSSGSRQLSDAELRAITSAILHDTRGVEILWDIGNSPEAACETEDRILVLLELETRHLSKTDPESVVGLLRVTPCADDSLSAINYSDVARLVYGQIESGTYRMKWDSPLLYAPSEWISYRDLNGDGTDEIVIWPSKVEEEEKWPGENDHGYPGGAVVFDREGHELTRGAFCSEYIDFFEDKTCPILADKLALVPGKSGKQLDIIATNWVDAQWRKLNGTVHRLHLDDGHYEPEPIPPMTPTPQHTETGPAKDAGLLLGLRQSSEVTSRYGVYRTLWITRVAGSVVIDQSRNLLVPRRDGFWQMGSNTSSRDDKKEEFVWLAPLGKQISMHELSVKEAATLPDEAAFARPVVFVSGDYVGLAQANYAQIESFHTYNLDDGSYQRPLDISSVAGDKATETLVRESEKGKSHMSMPVSMQGECNLEVLPVNWSVAREKGHWFVSGWGKWTEPKLGCSADELPDYVTSLRAPQSLVGFDELPVTWEQIAKVFPEATDAFGSPTWGLLVVLTSDEVLVCPVTQNGIGMPLARSPLLAYEKAVMAQWAVGKFVASWSEQFQHFKKNPGPRNELPNK